MSYRIGIDVGSKTVKIVVVDEDGTIIHHVYWRHRANIKRTLARMLKDLAARQGNIEGHVAVTGSAGIAVAKMLGVPFVQEVIATTKAVQTRYPHADAIVELGGEDAKVVYLSGNLEQRMNATCAGGTGGFIDTIAFMLGVRTSEMNHLAARAQQVYPIASRCAVFAQTDVRPLLNAGASKEDIAASALDAVVRQTLGGLACGRPLAGTLVFLGGPFEYIPELAKRFRMALNLNEDTGIRPQQAHLFTAYGTALVAGERADQGAAGAAASEPLSVYRLQELVSLADTPEDDMGHLPPLFADERARAAFEERHAAERMPRGSVTAHPGPLYLGVDAGSTTVKYALVNEHGELVSSGYRATDGDVLETARDMLSEMYELLPDDERTHIAQSVVIGYGDALIKAALRIDADIVETVAHLRAARAFRPDVSFVLDIGGQDMKALWVEDGQIVDAVLNEACSSGCGSFIEGVAYSMRQGPGLFALEAMRSTSPLELGTKCTVFMTSRVRHAQKIGATRSDIAAGIAYSVVQNALYRVIGRDKSAQMGDCVVVQGGAFKSDAVLRAFELVSGVEAVRPDTAHIMGAIGAALIARDHAHELRASGHEDPRSGVLDAKELEDFAPSYLSLRCNGCTNNCTLSVVEFDSSRRFVSGNRCSRGPEIAAQQLAEQSSTAAGGTGSLGAQGFGALGRKLRGAEAAAKAGSNASQSGSTKSGTDVRHIVVKAPTHHLRAFTDRKEQSGLGVELGALAAYGAKPGRRTFGSVKIGLLMTLSGYELMPFWHSFFSYLGFWIVDPAIPTLSDGLAYEQALPEDACTPIKLTARRMAAFAKAGVDAVFVPRYRKGERCYASEEYTAALCDTVAEDAAAGKHSPKLISPIFKMLRPENIVHDEGEIETLIEALSEGFGSTNLPRCRVLDALRFAHNEQVEFEKTVVHGVGHYLMRESGHESAREVALACRPCHMDPVLMPTLDAALSEHDLLALPALGFEHILRRHMRGGKENIYDTTGSGTSLVAPLNSDAAWRASDRAVQLAGHIVENPTHAMLVIDARACEFGSDASDEVSDVLEPAGCTCGTLLLEDVTDAAALDEQLSAFAAAAADQAENAGQREKPATTEDDEEGVSTHELAEDAQARAQHASSITPYLPSGLALDDDADSAAAPNVVHYQQQLLGAYTNVEGTKRAGIRIGLMTTLSSYERIPFWHTLLRALGFSVLMPEEELIEAVKSTSAESVASESVCIPAKLSHERLYALREAGANALFMPRYERGARCAVMCGYADSLADSIPFLSGEGAQALTFVSPTLRATRMKIVEGASQLTDPHSKELYDSLKELDPQAPLSVEEFEAAFAQAVAAQETFEEKVRRKTEAALAWTHEHASRHAVIVAGRPYHTDPALMHGIDGVLENLGFAVLPALGLRHAADDGTPMGSGFDSAYPWKPAKHLLRLARYVIAQPQLDMVVLQSFNCGYDAISLGDVREVLVQAGRPFTALKIDEIVDTAHVRIRLRTMAQAIAVSGERRRTKTATEVPRDRVPNRTYSESGQHESAALDLLADGLSDSDLQTARASAPADICFTAAATMAHALDKLHDDQSIERLRVPRACQGCVLDGLAHVIERFYEQVPDIDWEDSWHGAPQIPELAPQPEESNVRIGIVGNPLLCFDEYMNEGIVELLMRLGAWPVLPDPDLLFTDDVRYLDQLDAFEKEGVDAVLYLLSFGCMKGHVQARGALRELGRRYPNMPVTVLDYDPESSSLNRENRIRLAVEAARVQRNNA